MMRSIKQRTKGVLPSRAISAARTLRVRLGSWRYRGMTTRETFETIYRYHKWGGKEDFCSGRGSEDNMVKGYVGFIKGFIQTNGLRTVIDLGCGNFLLGRMLVEGSHAHYTGVDIVEALIQRNIREFAGRKVQFLCLDIIEDPLPEADLCLICQVLQHLDNAQIARILSKLGQYPYVIITEHIPIGRRIVPNRDKVHGPDTRLYSNSGVFVERPPFNLPATTVFESPEPFNGRTAVIRSSLIENVASSRARPASM
jgi:SAM-dependent methyltransferase